MDLLAIFIFCLIVMLFWRRRKDAERAQYLIKQKCQQLDLQLLDVNFKREKPQKMAGYWRWCRFYQFEFSSTGDSRYQGSSLWRAANISLNYRFTEWLTICLKVSDGLVDKEISQDCATARKRTQRQRKMPHPLLRYFFAITPRHPSAE